MHMYSPGCVLCHSVGRVDVTASKDVTAKLTGGQQVDNEGGKPGS